MGAVVFKELWSQVTMHGVAESLLLALFLYHINVGVQFSYSQQALS